MNWGWLDRNVDTVLEYLREHVEIAMIALLLGVLIAFPIGLIAYRWRITYAPLLALTQILYTVPSLALFVLLINAVGLGQELVAGAHRGFVAGGVVGVAGLQRQHQPVEEAAAVGGGAGEQAVHGGGQPQDRQPFG